VNADVSELGRRRGGLAYLALYSEDVSNDRTARLAAEVAAAAGLSLTLSCVFDAREAKIPMPSGHGPSVAVYVEGSRAAQEAEECARRHLERLQRVCGQTCELESAVACVGCPGETLDGLAATTRAVALPKHDFYELARWYRPKTPFHTLSEHDTPIVALPSDADSVCHRALVVDVKTVLSSAVSDAGATVEGIVSESIPASDTLAGEGTWSWGRIQDVAEDTDCDTIVVRSPRRMSVPLVGRHARLRHAVSETERPMILV